MVDGLPLSLPICSQPMLSQFINYSSCLLQIFIICALENLAIIYILKKSQFFSISYINIRLQHIPVCPRYCRSPLNSFLEQFLIVAYKASINYLLQDTTIGAYILQCFTSFYHSKPESRRRVEEERLVLYCSQKESRWEDL